MSVPRPRPIVIAHRGASGRQPENTPAAFELGHKQGADLIETDVVLTRDDTLICLHDLTINATTDAAERYADRSRDDGLIYAIDLDADEIKALQAHARGGPPLGTERVPTFRELLDLVARLNRETGRGVGVIVEPKSPAWHTERGRDIVAALVGAAAGSAVEVIVQSFDLDALRRARELNDRIRLVYLTADTGPPPWNEIIGLCWGIGPEKSLLSEPLVRNAHEHGFVVLAWTFGEDADETRRAFEFGVDGVFTDFPDIARSVS